MSIHDQAYVIYTAHYQETSALVKLLTREHGVVSAVVRGVHQPTKKSGALRAAVQLGNLVECQWSGKSSLKTIYQLELAKPAFFDSAQKFICLSYVHELLLYFLREEYPADNLFFYYHNFLEDIAANQVEVALRIFEFRLLETMGYGVDFCWDIANEKPVDDEMWYQVIPGSGVRPADFIDKQAIQGRDLLEVQQQNFSSAHLLQVAKRISRQLLAYHMEGKPIKARQLYQELFNQ